MPEYLAPGVYIEELAGPKPIEGVGTSTGAFVGLAEKGPVNSAQLITNLTQFNNTFGGFLPGSFLAYAVQHFFTEGGTRCYVTRVFKHTAATAKADVAKFNLRTADDATSTVVMTVFASSPGKWGENVSVKASAVVFPPDPKKFNLSVFLAGSDEPVEIFEQLSMNEFDSTGVLPNPDHVERRINGISKYITVVDASILSTEITPPAFTAAAKKLESGSDGLPPGTTAASNLVPIDLIGTEAAASGLHAFDGVDDINIVAIPDLVHPAFDKKAGRAAINDGMTYCANRKDCFYVADTVSGLTPQTALNYKQGTGTDFVGNAFTSKYGALYYPWIFVTDPLTGKAKLVPPSGAVVGAYAYSDSRVGVHKAPAGIDDGYLNSAVDIERAVTKGEQDTLNPQGVNVIRKFTETGIVIWGARTVSSDPEWKYVNVRRLFIFLEESILKGTQGVVFEPNDQSLWKRIIRDVGAFLRIQWSEGKLVGDKPEKAFFVKCDAETNPPESVDLGRVITIIGVAPSKPAEFVIFRIKQTRAGGDASE